MKFKNIKQHEKKARKSARAAERMERKSSEFSYRKVNHSEWQSQPRRWCKLQGSWLYPVVVDDKQTWVRGS